MSVTFTSSERCDCVERWSADAESNPSCEICRAEMNLANRNAADLLEWLGLPVDDLTGSAPARDIAARCRRRLWDVPRNHDAEIETIELSPRATIGGRPAGYLRQKTELLLKLAERAGDGQIYWS